MCASSLTRKCRISGVPADRTGELGAVADQTLPDAGQHGGGLLIDGLGRHEPHRRGRPWRRERISFPRIRMSRLWHSVRDLLGSFCLVITAGPGSATKPGPIARMGRVPRCAWENTNSADCRARGEWGRSHIAHANGFIRCCRAGCRRAIHSPRPNSRNQLKG